MEDGQKTKVVEKRLRIERHYPEDLTTHFITHFVAQHQPDHFVLSLFEVWLPAILGETEEERLQIVEEIETVKAKCVSRLVLTPEKMREFIAVLQQNLDNYDKLMGAVSEEGSK